MRSISARKLLVMGAFAIVAVGGSSAAVVAADKDAPPARPNWVGPDGLMKPGEFRVPVLGPDGRVQRDAQGQERTMDPRNPLPLPAAPDPAAARTQPGAVDANGVGSREIKPSELRRP